MKKILVVDDSLEVRRVSRDILVELGFEPIICKSGEEAIGFVKEADAVLSDFCMPGGMDGATFIEKARLQKPEIPAAIITSYPGEVPFGYEIIKKPFGVAPIEEWVRKVAKD